MPCGIASAPCGIAQTGRRAPPIRPGKTSNVQPRRSFVGPGALFARSCVEPKDAVERMIMKPRELRTPSSRVGSGDAQHRSCIVARGGPDAVRSLSLHHSVFSRRHDDVPAGTASKRHDAGMESGHDRECGARSREWPGDHSPSEKAAPNRSGAGRRGLWRLGRLRWLGKRARDPEGVVTMRGRRPLLSGPGRFDPAIAETA